MFSKKQKNVQMKLPWEYFLLLRGHSPLPDSARCVAGAFSPRMHSLVPCPCVSVRPSGRVHVESPGVALCSDCPMDRAGLSSRGRGHRPPGSEAALPFAFSFLAVWCQVRLPGGFQKRQSPSVSGLPWPAAHAQSPEEVSGDQGRETASR